MPFLEMFGIFVLFTCVTQGIFWGTRYLVARWSNTSVVLKWRELQAFSFWKNCIIYFAAPVAVIVLPILFLIYSKFSGAGFDKVVLVGGVAVSAGVLSLSCSFLLVVSNSATYGEKERGYTVSAVAIPLVAGVIASVMTVTISLPL